MRDFGVGVPGDVVTQAQAQGWTKLLARISGRYNAEWWAMAYANNPLWHIAREGLDELLLEPIGVEACLAMLEQWPHDDHPIWSTAQAVNE